MGLFGNKREKSEKADKYEYQSSSKAARACAYGPPALAATPPSPYLPGAAAYFDGYGQVGPQGKFGKYGKYPGMSKSLYGADPMQQAMLLPPQSSAAMQAQATAIYQMQQYMQGQGGGAPYAGVLPPIQMSMGAPQQAGMLPVQQGQSYFNFGGQAGATPFFDPASVAFQQQGAFAPYQQPNFYDPAGASAFAGAYGYMPSAY